MYTLMNKNTVLIDFEWSGSEALLDTRIIKEYYRPWFIGDLTYWLKNRSITKHRGHMGRLLSQLGLTDIKSIIDFSKGLSLTDTLWINKDDRYDWEEVNLFDNEFDEVIEKIAFDGGMYGAHMSTTSPEFGTDGVCAKCWKREADGEIYLYKQGSSGAVNAGNEVYSEMYASQILDVLGYNHATYNVIKYRGKEVSRCKLFTSKKKMLLPMSIFAEGRRYGIADVIRYCEDEGFKEKLAELLITDAIILNEDRHLGNIGLSCNADTFEVEGLSPIYDNGLSLLCYLHNNTADEYKKTRTPRLYDQFIPMAKEVATDNQIKHLDVLKNFKFDTSGSYNLPESRIKELERVVQEQIYLLQTYKLNTTNEF